ncbi:MAG TPA: hypothetical protein PJ994_02005 [Tepidiformaceae bacterium]|nr:hypothetical protein [Tepidiformaceae bacterium]HMO96106.1 hypothetical protein [Tepidiformaceae bacterium]
MRWFRRKPRITEEIYGNLMTSFGRAGDLDPLVKEPAQALAERICAESPETVLEVDSRTYAGSTLYHLRLLAGSWIMASEGSVPHATAEVFEEAVAWKLGPHSKDASALSHRLSSLARGEIKRDLRR